MSNGPWGSPRTPKDPLTTPIGPQRYPIGPPEYPPRAPKDTGGPLMIPKNLLWSMGFLMVPKDPWSPPEVFRVSKAPELQFTLNLMPKLINNLRLWSGFFMMMLLNCHFCRMWRGVSLCDGSGMMSSVTMVRTTVVLWNHRCPGFNPYSISDHFWIDIGCQVGKYGEEDKYQLDDFHFAKKIKK